MRHFQYQWELHGHKMTGAYDCENRAQLEEHVRSLGGTLLEIKSEDAAAPKQAAGVNLIPKTEHSATTPTLAAVEEGGKNYLQAIPYVNDPPWVLKVWGWCHILSGIFLTTVIVLLAIVTVITGGSFIWGQGPYPTFWIKFAFIGVFGILSVLNAGFGVLILSFPLFAARLLFVLAVLGLLGAALELVQGNVASALICGGFNGFLMGYFLKKRVRHPYW